MAETTTTEENTLPKFVKLISCDNKEFIIEREVVCHSKTLSMFLDPTLGWSESQTGEIHLSDIPGELLERVCTFLHYRRRFEGVEDHPPFDIKAEEALQLLLVADYLEM